MENERQISEAKSVIKSLFAKFSRKRRRYHRSAAEDDLLRLRALEGLCGECENVRVAIFYLDGKRKTEVDCETSQSPVELYYNTLLGKRVDCPDFTPRE